MVYPSTKVSCQTARLALSHNMLSGVLPTELGNCNLLSKSTGSPMRLCFAMAAHASLLPAWLHASFNSLNGTIPTELGELTRLQGLDLSNNAFSGLLPSELGGLSALGT